MSTATLISRGLTINNPNRQIERISNNPDDFSLFNKKDNLQKIKLELESSLIVTTIPENKTQQANNILCSKEPLINERNAILSNPFKYYNPYYRKKLKKIDAKLDYLDLQLYILESGIKQIESDLDRAIESAQEKLKNALALSPNKNFFNK